MTIKKVKWLWSYKIEKTEQWLTKMAQQGWHLSAVDRLTRTFTFEKGSKKNVTYCIQYAPKHQSLSLTLQKEGWHPIVMTGNWLFLLNEEAQIRLYPARDSIVKRNRLHAYTFSLLAIFQLATQVPMILLSTADGFSFLEDSLVVFLLLLAEGTALAIFSGYVFRSYRQFEIREMDAAIDDRSSGKKTYKFKPGWMYHLVETKRWLEELAEDGYELEKVTASIFTFRKVPPSTITYECIFEYKVQPSFFTIHKELGWKLKYSSSITLLNYSIWAMDYNIGEAVPQFSYNKKEQQQSIKRAFKMNVGISFYLILILSFSLYSNTVNLNEPFITWSVGGVMRPLVLGLLIFWIYKFIQIVLAYRRNMKY